MQRQDLASLVCVRPQDYLHRILTAYPVISPGRPSGIKYPKVVKEYTWEPIHMSDLKEMNDQRSNRLHSLFVREMVKMWASSTKASPHNWLQLISAVL